MIAELHAWHNVTKIKPGLIFENIGSLQTQASSWKIVTYINLTTYFAELNYVESLVTEVEGQCNLLKETNETEVLCDKIIMEMKDDIMELRDNNRFFIPKRASRVKRGQLNIVGHGLKFLFGTMDSSDANYYYDHIRQLEQSETKTKTLISEHTSILSSTFEKLNEIIVNLNEQGGTMTELKDEIFTLKKSARRAEYFTRIHYLFDELTVYIKISTDKVRRDQQKLFDITTSAYHGLMHESIFNPHGLMDAMREISADLRGTMFPLPLMDSNLYRILALGELAAVYANNTLIFEIKAPLITAERYQIYKITTVPEHIRDHVYSYITPTDEMLVVADGREKYFFTNKIQLELDGKIINENHHLLKTANPMYILHSRPSCETVCLIQGKIDNKLCSQTTRTLSEELWVQLAQPNTYLFVLPRETLISVKCKEEEIIHVILEGIGMLKTNSCEVTTNYVILPAASQGKWNFTMQFRQLNMINLTTIVKPSESYIQPTAIASTKSIDLLNNTPLIEDNQKEHTSFFGQFTLVLLVILTISVIGMYMFVAWLWRGAKRFRKENKTKMDAADEATPETNE